MDLISQNTLYKNGDIDCFDYTDDSKTDLLNDFEYAIKTVGFFKIDNLLNSQDLIRSLISDLEVLFEAHEASTTANKFPDIVHQLLGRGESFLELVLDPTINEYAEKILSSTCIIHSYNAVKLMPLRANNATKIHRDSPRFYTQNYPLCLQALVCLDPFTLDNGATYLLPGSHHLPAKPTDEYFYKNAIRICANPGDVIFFDSLIWHTGGVNRTNLPRRAITIVYNRSFMRQQIDLVKAISSEYIEKMPPLVKKLIGMNVRVPASRDEFFLPEEARLYKANQG